VEPGSKAVSSGTWRGELPLVGAGGEPVDLWRSIQSHGLVDLPPMRIDEDARALEITIPLPRTRPRTVLISPGAPGFARATVAGRRLGRRQEADVLAAVAHVLRLDEDMSSFYEVAANDPQVAWAATGAGRLVRSPTVFEEVVKTICTTNCAWSATERMVGALVEHLGEPAVGAPAGPYGRAFPTPAAMASASESFYRDVVRAGYRGAYLRSLAADVASGALDLEALGRADRDQLPDDDLEALLLALPGVGPYAAAHIMMLLGRYSRLVLDSWTRPKYASMNGGRTVKDSAIERRFRRYGPYAGLAFWLVLTRDWVPEA
jgi:3-methyladenine DNA glycosylase/8-oxoguanine DNA glycosylase